MILYDFCYMFQILGPKSWRVLQKQPSGNSRNSINVSQRQSTSATGAGQTKARTASRNPPSTRTGDQDDVSEKQTPSN